MHYAFQSTIKSNKPLPAEACDLLNQIKSFSFVIALITFDRILSSTKQLSDNIQSSSIDLSRATELVLANVSLL